jgi:hypothetical protein
MLHKTGFANFTAHSQQSLHFLHCSHRWLLQLSFVHLAHMRVDPSPQMLHKNGIGLSLPSRRRPPAGLRHQRCSALTSIRV